MKNKVQIYGVVGLLVGGAIAAAGITQAMKMGHQDICTLTLMQGITWLAMTRTLGIT